MDAALARVRPARGRRALCAEPVPLTDRIDCPGPVWSSASRGWPGGCGPRPGSPSPAASSSAAEVVGVGQVVDGWSGARVSGAPFGQRPTILAASQALASGCRRAVARLAWSTKRLEALHVLAQLAEDEIAAVAAQVGQLRIAGPGQDPARIVGRRHRRGLGDLPVLVLVAEDELTGTHGVQEDPGWPGGSSSAISGLGDAVAEAERLCAVQRVELPRPGRRPGGRRTPRAGRRRSQPRLVLGGSSSTASTGLAGPPGATVRERSRRCRRGCGDDSRWSSRP